MPFFQSALWWPWGSRHFRKHDDISQTRGKMYILKFCQMRSCFDPQGYCRAHAASLFLCSCTVNVLFLELRGTWSILWSLTVSRSQSCRFRPHPGCRPSPKQRLLPRLRPSTAPLCWNSWRKLRSKWRLVNYVFMQIRK